MSKRCLTRSLASWRGTSKLSIERVTFSATVRRGLSVCRGSWKTICRSLRWGRIWDGERPTSSASPKWTLPTSARIRLRISRPEGGLPRSRAADAAQSLALEDIEAHVVHRHDLADRLAQDRPLPHGEGLAQPAHLDEGLAHLLRARFRSEQVAANVGPRRGDV